MVNISFLLRGRQTEQGYLEDRGEGWCTAARLEDLSLRFLALNHVGRGRDAKRQFGSSVGSSQSTESQFFLIVSILVSRSQNISQRQMTVRHIMLHIQSS